MALKRRLESTSQMTYKKSRCRRDQIFVVEDYLRNNELTRSPA